MMIPSSTCGHGLASRPTDGVWARPPCILPCPFRLLGPWPRRRSRPVPHCQRLSACHLDGALQALRAGAVLGAGGRVDSRCPPRESIRVPRHFSLSRRAPRGWGGNHVGDNVSHWSGGRTLRSRARCRPGALGLAAPAFTKRDHSSRNPPQAVSFTVRWISSLADCGRRLRRCAPRENCAFLPETLPDWMVRRSPGRRQSGDFSLSVVCIMCKIGVPQAVGLGQRGLSAGHRSSELRRSNAKRAILPETRRRLASTARRGRSAPAGSRSD